VTGAALLLALCAQGDPSPPVGVKVGEVTDTSVIVWARAKGRVELRLGGRTESAETTEATDFAHSFRLSGLAPATVHAYSVNGVEGRFETAPAADRPADITFTVLTGMMYKDLDHPDGFHIYESMAALKPKFVVPTGDTVYYDIDPPLANTTALCRFHWQRMYALPRHVKFHLSVPGYWEKDDHDVLWDDCWPTMKQPKAEPHTFAEGLRIFREQVPMGEKTYRTFRWGKDLQIWLTEGRDFRSPNPAPDGPEKTIWGAEQKAWLKKSLLESDATWKVLVSPTPVVGPDRAGKGDNHANKAFAHEGDEIRRWFRENVAANFFIACGDRHWQYHSVHPETGVQEFSCGPASDKHAGGSPGMNKDYHRFHRMKGGFLSVSASRPGGKPSIAFRLHDVHGAIVHEHVAAR
jgi:alkaline phosphatase D